MRCPTNTEQFRRQRFFCCRTQNLERSATGTATRGHQLWTIQKKTHLQNSWVTGPKLIKCLTDVEGSLAMLTHAPCCHPVIRCEMSAHRTKVGYASFRRDSRKKSVTTATFLLKQSQKKVGLILHILKIW